MKDHGNDWLNEDSESMRITDLENRVAELEAIVELQAAQLERAADGAGWRCPDCDEINSEDFGVCSTCGRPRR